MKGIVLAFLSISVSLIGWRYLDKTTKRNFKTIVRNNFGSLLFALVVVVLTLVISMNITMRLI